MIFRFLGLLLRRFLSLAKPTVLIWDCFVVVLREVAGTPLFMSDTKKIKQRNKQYNLNKQKKAYFFFLFFPLFFHMDAALKSKVWSVQRWAAIFKREHENKTGRNCRSRAHNFACLYHFTYTSFEGQRQAKFKLGACTLIILLCITVGVDLVLQTVTQSESA